jgi:hypothetical protein
VVRISRTDDGEELTLKIEGQFEGPGVNEIWAIVLRPDSPQLRLAIDIHDLTFADPEGEQILLWLHRMGARFCGGGSYSHLLCDRLGIPLSPAREKRTYAESSKAPR